MKSGRTKAGIKAAASHTAALTSSDAAVDSLFHQAGVVRAETLEELVDVAALLSTQPLPLGRGVALLTNAGGLGILAADACEAAGLELPALDEATRDALRKKLPSEASVANPVDMLGSATAKTYEEALPLVLADRHVDAVIVLFVPPVTATADEVAEAVVRSARESEKPVLAVIIDANGIPPALRSGDVAAFTYPESAARALGRAVERREWLRRPAGSVPTLTGIDVERGRSIVEESLRRAPDRWLEPEEARALLIAYGIPVVEQRVVDSPDAAVRGGRGARLSRRRQDGRAGRAQDRDRRRETRPEDAGGGARGRRGDRRRRALAADAEQQRRAPRGRRARPTVRAARRARPRAESSPS